MMWLIWLGVAVACGLVELLTLDLIFLMLAGGGLAASLTAAVTAPWWVQIVVFCLVSVLMLAAVRPWALGLLRIRGQSEHVTGAAATVGRRGEALTQITAEGGRVKIMGEVWTARTSPGAIPIGAADSVVVTALDGATAIVTAATEVTAKTNQPELT